MQNSSDPVKRALAFIDILGFRDLVMSTSLDDLAPKYERVLDTVEAFNHPLGLGDGKAKLFPEATSGESWCLKYIFSDPLILIALDDTENSCLKLLVYAWRLSQVLLSMGMPLRGGVVHGELYVDTAKSIVLGKALTQAYDLEKQQQWIGVALDQSIWNRYPRLHESIENPQNVLNAVFPEYDVPFKSGELRKLRTLNWRFNLVAKKGTRTMFSNASDSSAAEKIENTLKYAKQIVASINIYPSGKNLPMESERFYVGSETPPFEHGDDY